MAVSPALTERIRGEFVDMPALKLTTAQACRLWNLNERQCCEALDALIAEGFLFRTPSGAFIALPSAVNMVKASLPEASHPRRCPYCQHLNSIQADPALRVPYTVTTFRCSACARVVSAA